MLQRSRSLSFLLLTLLVRYFSSVCVAYVFRHDAGNSDGEGSAEGDATATHEVRRLSYYTHESTPHAGDPLPCVVRWLKLAAALHAPLEPAPEKKDENDAHAKA